MIYEIDLNCITDTMRVLVKEKEDKNFKYKTIRKIAKLLEKGVELYSFNPNNPLVKILKIEYVGLQEFYKIKAFSGSQLLLGKEAEVFVDGDWLKVYELRFHEKVYEFNIIKNLYLDTYFTDIYYHNKQKAFKVHIDDEYGIIVNSLMIRFPGYCPPPVNDLIKEESSEK